MNFNRSVGQVEQHFDGGFRRVEVPFKGGSGRLSIHSRVGPDGFKYRLGGSLQGWHPFQSG